jgi:CRISPR-associated protein Csm2
MEIKFWKDEAKKQIDPDLFCATAENLAKKIHQEADKSGKNKPSQIRKFYDEVMRFDSILKMNPDEFENALPYLRMLNAKAAYAAGRSLISDGFKDFISNSLKGIKDKDDFYAFAGLFEAFMGYYKFFDAMGNK